MKSERAQARITKQKISGATLKKTTFGLLTLKKDHFFRLCNIGPLFFNIGAGAGDCACSYARKKGLEHTRARVGCHGISRVA
jgi:hypothetical protein